MAHVATVTISAAQVSADLTDFPIYLNLADMPALFWSTVANGGGDIRCYKAGGSIELPREVVSCDTATDTGELHVKYSGVLSSSADTEIEIHADGSSADYAVGHQYGRNAVWADYYAVIHGHEAGTNGVHTDSTGNGHDTVLRHGTPVTAVGRPLGGSWSDFNNDFVLGLASTRGVLNGAADFTFQCILRPDSLNTADGVMGNRYSQTDVNWFGMQSSGRTFTKVTGSENLGEYPAIADVQWRVGVQTSTSLNVYDNGVARATDPNPIGWPPSTDAFDDVRIGTYYAADSDSFGGYDGKVGEIRLRRSALSAGWISSEHNNQSAPATFYTVAEVSGGGGPTPVTADLGESLSAAILSASGNVVEPITGGMSVSLGAASIAAAAISDIEGSLSAASDAVTVNAGGSPEAIANLSESLDAVSMSASASGVDSREGSLNETLGIAAGSASASTEVIGSLNQTLAQAGLSGSAESFIEAVLSASLDAINIASTGSSFETITAVLSETLGVVHADSVGSLDIAGTLNANLGVLQVSASADSEIVGELVAALSASTIDAGTTVYSGIAGELDLVLNSVDLRASAVGPFSAESALYFRGKLTATITFRGSLTSDLVFRSKLN